MSLSAFIVHMHVKVVVSACEQDVAVLRHERGRRDHFQRFVNCRLGSAAATPAQGNATTQVIKTVKIAMLR
jgi:hypothetical protein